MNLSTTYRLNLPTFTVQCDARTNEIVPDPVTVPVQVESLPGTATSDLEIPNVELHTS
jgi:hypothetical protein